MSGFSKRLAMEHEIGDVLMKGLRESVFIIYGALSLLILIALLTFSPDDPGWTHDSGKTAVANAVGPVGAWLADLLLSLFGVIAYPLPFLLASYGLTLYQNRENYFVSTFSKTLSKFCFTYTWRTSKCYW